MIHEPWTVLFLSMSKFLPVHFSGLWICVSCCFCICCACSAIFNIVFRFETSSLQFFVGTFQFFQFSAEKRSNSPLVVAVAAVVAVFKLVSAYFWVHLFRFLLGEFICSSLCRLLHPCVAVQLSASQ